MTEINLQHLTVEIHWRQFNKEENISNIFVITTGQSLNIYDAVYFIFDERKSKINVSSHFLSAEIILLSQDISPWNNFQILQYIYIYRLTRCNVSQRPA